MKGNSILKTALSFLLVTALVFLTTSLEGGTKGNPSTEQEKTQIEVFFAPKGGIEAKLANLIQNAQSSILIAAYNIFLPDVSLSLLGAKAKGVQIRIIMDSYGPKVEKSDFPLLQRNGIPLVLRGGTTNLGAMNHCFAVFDGKQLAIGSYRWTETGEREDYSSMIFTNDPDAVKTYTDQFQKIWSGG